MASEDGSQQDVVQALVALGLDTLQYCAARLAILLVVFCSPGFCFPCGLALLLLLAYTAARMSGRAREVG